MKPSCLKNGKSDTNNSLSPTEEMQQHNAYPIGRTPQPILKKRNSFESRAQIHPILKRNSRDEINNASFNSSLIVSPPVHSILKKSSSDEKANYEPHFKPILKKSSFDDSQSDKSANQVKPILKHTRYRGESKSESDVICRPIIKPIQRHSEPSTPEGRVITQEEIEADLNREAATFSGPFIARVMQPRRKSHPNTYVDWCWPTNNHLQ